MGQTKIVASPRAILRRLADVRAEHTGVLSVFMDLDPSVYPTAKQRRSEITGLLTEAADRFIDGDVDADERHAREEAIDHVRDVLNDPDIASDGTRSVAVFAAPSEDVFEVLRLPYAIAPAVVVDDSPYLRPLADDAGPRTWVVLLVDRRKARILYGGPRRLIELGSYDDNVPAHQKQGGWSAPGYQRHADEAARDHIQHALGELFAFFERSRFDALAIAAPDPTYDEVVDALQSELRERLRGRVRIEVDFPSPGQVLDELQPLFDEARERAVGELLDRIEEASRDLVTTTPADTLAALNDRRVDTLVIEQEYSVGGVRCPKCSWLALEGERCGLDQAPTERRDDIVDDAVDVALMQAARVVTVPTDADRHPQMPICALLRY